jgi:streptomycin 6-kinase
VKELIFLLQLPEVYQNHIISVYKDRGKQWLKELPHLINDCERKWEMKVGTPFELSYNFVAPAILKDNTEVVLKLSIPSQDFSNEFMALKLFNQYNNKMVKLLDYDLENGIILLERLTPGKMLSNLEDDEKATQIAAQVVRKLWLPAPADIHLPSTKCREESLRKITKINPHGLGPISDKLLKEAEDMFAHLHVTSTDHFLLHGDLHHYNILSAEDDWRVIDPKGLVGEREYDLIQFLLNKLPDEGYKEVIQRRIDIFVEELQLNKERLLKWSIAHSVLSTAWSVAEDEETYSKSFFLGIGALRELYAEFISQTQ